MPKNALILIDLQNDFCPGGSLAVPEGDAVVPLANQLQKYFDIIVATKDWHPPDHMSFASNHPGKRAGEVISVNNITQVLWPDHCVQNTRGSDFHPLLDVTRINHIIYKGVDKNIDSYSAFFDNQHLRSTGLGEYLRSQAVDKVYIMGLATDYCVKYSCLDAVQLGFEVYLVEDACRGIDLNKGDIAQAFAEMQAAGIKIIKIADIIKSSFT